MNKTYNLEFKKQGNMAELLVGRTSLKATVWERDRPG
jgi:hypothetical protein